jgi:arylsulfatase A-like enzyme
MKRPNVIVFFTDQQRHDTTGVHGCPLGLTPHFDSLAQDGTHLFHAFTTQPVCGPSRACLQTSTYATRSGCWRNGIPLPQDTRTLAHGFREGGYHTGYIGKWHLAPSEFVGAVPPEWRGGYDSWLASNTLEMTSDSYSTTLYDEDGQARFLPGYRADALADAAIRHVHERSQEEQPFFLFLSFLEPHHQNHLDNYPAPLASKYLGNWMPADLASLGGSAHAHWEGYCAMVKRLDDALGRVLDALESLSLREDTIVVFTSDHACHFKTRNDEYKRSAHESSIRVPLALDGGPFRGGGRVKKLATLLDLGPTLLDACGLPALPAGQGRSVLPLLHGQKAEWEDEVFVQISESQVGRALRTARWKYAVSAHNLSGSKHSHADHYTEDALFDLQADPHELTNIIGMDAFRDVACDLRARLLKRILDVEGSTPRLDVARSHPCGQRRPAVTALEQTAPPKAAPVFSLDTE